MKEDGAFATGVAYRYLLLLAWTAGLKPVRVGDLRDGAAIEGAEALRLELSPVVSVNEKQVVAGPQNPAEARLPAENAAHRVVLNIVADRNPGTELRADHAAEDLRGEFAFGQRQPVPLVFDGRKDTRERPRGHGQREFAPPARIEAA